MCCRELALEIARGCDRAVQGTALLAEVPHFATVSVCPSHAVRANCGPQRR